ncbi:hypothetical protein JS578_05145 [Dysgonomonadaceae bacterium zrk40]|nr:hypothetical protein JS578_05145 [Dysgonomonadaceae bacterium zrk40]
MEDFYFDDDFDDDFEPQKSFSDILFELERNGTILQQWESGAPDENAPTKTKTNEL